MKGDFARVTFDPARHYSQVFQQQGRVLLEADWNEQGHIQLHLLRALVKDLIGPCWAPGTGFSIAGTSTDANGKTTTLALTDWTLSPGHFYADGILCELEQSCTLSQQPYRPTPDYGIGDGKSGFENPPAQYALWLDVWERHLCSLEAPSIADVALDGVDTASRAQVVWQVRLIDPARADKMLDDVTAALNLRLDAHAGDENAIKQQLAKVAALRKQIDGSDTSGNNNDPCTLIRQVLQARQTYACPRLVAGLGTVEGDDDPCVIAADARYRGCENQAYRVEIHQGGLAGGTAGATFKWSRENGSVVFPIMGSAVPTTGPDGNGTLAVTLGRLGRDERLGLAVDDWVELVDDDYTLAQRAFPLLQVVAVDVANRMATLRVPKGITPYAVSASAAKHPLLRRWDQGDGANAQGVVPVAEGDAIALEDGVEVTFDAGGLYATGDYWIVPARVAGGGTLDWPQASGGPAMVRARGLHHYAVLGVADDNEDGYRECCCRFEPLCSLIHTRTEKADVVVAKTDTQATKAVTKAPRVSKTGGTSKTGKP